MSAKSMIFLWKNYQNLQSIINSYLFFPTQSSGFSIIQSNTPFESRFLDAKTKNIGNIKDVIAIREISTFPNPISENAIAKLVII